MKKLFWFLGISIIIILFLARAILPEQTDRVLNQITEHRPFKTSIDAQKLHETLFIGDWHADSALWSRDLSIDNDHGHVDIPKLQKGNVALQMFTTVTKSPSGQNYDKNETNTRDNITTLAIVQGWPIKTWTSLYERAVFQSQKIHKLSEENPNDLMLIKSKLDLSSFLEKRKKNTTLIGGLIGTEGSHALDGDLENIKRLYNHGFRMMSLHHFFDNKLGGSLHGTTGDGLSPFGKNAVEIMQDLEIIIDVSHSSENVVKDVLKLSSRPLVVSHTGFNGHCESPRNISDELMKSIANKGGLIAIGYWDGAICDNSPKSVASALMFGIDLVGEDHLSLGSDFDGSITPGFDTSELVAITHWLIKLGATESQIRKIMGKNMLLFIQTYLPNEGS
jgi:microsomal dipeptidase-like Zn-dependent dipeptidase